MHVICCNLLNININWQPLFNNTRELSCLFEVLMCASCFIKILERHIHLYCFMHSVRFHHYIPHSFSNYYTMLIIIDRCFCVIFVCQQHEHHGFRFLWYKHVISSPTTELHHTSSHLQFLQLFFSSLFTSWFSVSFFFFLPMFWFFFFFFYL